MNIDLKYGKHGLEVELAEANVTEIFRTIDMPAIEHPGAHGRR